MTETSLEGTSLGRRFVVPMLHSNAPDAARQGAVAVVGRLIANLGLQLVPYANLLVVPLMGLTSDPLPPVRAAATSAFAASVALLPLAQAGFFHTLVHLLFYRGKVN